MSEVKIKNGLIHCHSSNSHKDSTMTVTELVKVAKSMGCPAITLTDHGTMSGIYELIRASREVVKDGKVIEPSIKAIPGVEAYIEEDDSLTKRSHLVLLAKNYDGYKAICRAVTKSNSRIDTVPRMNMEILKEFFGDGSIGHNNVIATSACVAGVISNVLLQNWDINSQVSKLMAKQSKYSNPNDESYRNKLKQFKEIQVKIEELAKKRDSLKAISDKKYTARQRALSKLSGENLKTLTKALNEEMAESKRASEELASVKLELSRVRRKETAIRGECKDAEKSHEKFNAIQEKIDTLLSAIKSEPCLYNQAVETAKEYVKIFGKGNFYIELQYHGISEEKEVMPILYKIASELDIPTVAANDVHFAYNTPECARARKIVNSLRYNKWYPSRSDESEYYIKSDNELTEWLSKILPKEAVKEAMDGILRIVSQCNVVFPKEKHYPRFISDTETSSQRLRRLVEEGIVNRYPDKPFPYRDRVEYELSIIEQMQYTDYLCIVQDYLEYGRKLGKDNPEGVGYAIGPGRGSAAGSLVCYLIGITSIDPMPLGLLFERFLNPDRVTSPDIDADLSKEVRGKVIEYIKEKYGEKAVCSIMTTDTAASKKAVEVVARIRCEEIQGDSSYYLELGKEIKKRIPEDAKNLKECKDELINEFSYNSEAVRIIKDALLIEGTALNYGMHAAGVIISDNGDVGEYIPLMWNKENQLWTTQCNKEEAEEQAGLLKFDLLGLRTLDIITDTLRYIKQNRGISIDIEKVPQERVVYEEIFAKGNTNFVFQFESPGMKNMLKRFKPEKLEHIIILNAMYRPGPLQYIPNVCDVKNGIRKPTYICESARNILEPTYSYPIYQEQIIKLCSEVAGFSLGEADTIRRYMAKKNTEKMAQYQAKFVDGLKKQGVSEEEAIAFWNELMNFSSYGFNKSHAAAYAMLAYYTAYLKYHYPVEYMTAMLNHSPNDKFPLLVQECKMLGVKLVPPQINKSLIKFSCQGDSILFGLSNIKNVANSANTILIERENGPFLSCKDFIRRINPRSDVFDALVESGTMDMWCHNRAAMKYVLSELKGYLKKISDIEEALKTEKSEKKVEQLNNKLKKYTELYETLIFPLSIPENKITKYERENELLGMYISGHPLDEYSTDTISKLCNIVDIDTENKYLTVYGAVSKLRYKNRKSDGKRMAFFTLEDKTDVIKVSCFAETYEKYGENIVEGAVISIFGRTEIDIDGDNFEKSIIASVIRTVPRKLPSILVSVPDMIVWTTEIYPILKQYESTTGYTLVICDKALSEFREANFKVSDEILALELENCKIGHCDY